METNAGSLGSCGQWPVPGQVHRQPLNQLRSLSLSRTQVQHQAWLDRSQLAHESPEWQEVNPPLISERYFKSPTESG